MQVKADATGIPVEEVIASVMEHVSLCRTAEEYELANVAVFLASDESSAMTAQTVVAHCGLVWASEPGRLVDLLRQFSSLTLGIAYCHMWTPPCNIRPEARSPGFGAEMAQRWKQVHRMQREVRRI